MIIFLYSFFSFPFQDRPLARPAVCANDSSIDQLLTAAFAKRSIAESRKQRGGKQSSAFKNG